MPELPEVQCVVNSIEPRIINKEIKDVSILSKRLREPLSPDLKELVGKKVLSVERKGKYILIKISGAGEPFFLIVHLGMTGALLFRGNEDEVEKHDHLILEFGGFKLVYNDVRKFGIVMLEKDLSSNKYINKLGKEPLDADFIVSNVLFDKSRKTKKPIKIFLLDQTVVAGLGNIYVMEALFIAKINPLIPANKLNKEDYEKLSSIIVDLLVKSIKMGGSSISDYKDADNKKGNFQSTFKVYGKKECEVCNSKINKITQGGRSTYFCSNCQISN